MSVTLSAMESLVWTSFEAELEKISQAEIGSSAGPALSATNFADFTRARVKGLRAGDPNLSLGKALEQVRSTYGEDFGQYQKIQSARAGGLPHEQAVAQAAGGASTPPAPAPTPPPPPPPNVSKPGSPVPEPAPAPKSQGTSGQPAAQPSPKTQPSSKPPPEIKTPTPGGAGAPQAYKGTPQPKTPKVPTPKPGKMGLGGKLGLAAGVLGLGATAYSFLNKDKTAAVMNPHMRDELIKIAQQRDLPCFRALDKLANSMMGYGGMNTGGAQMSSPPSTGATNMPGMSMHCDKCFCEIKEPAAFCPKCGGKIRKVMDMKAIKERLKGKPLGDKQVSDEEDYKALPVGETGAEAAENEELAEGSYADTGKYASSKKERRKTQRAMKRALNRFAKENGIDPSKAMLVAGGAAYLHGLRDDINDIDFFHPDLKGFVKKQQGRFEMDGGPARDLPAATKQWQRIGGMRVQTPEAMLAFYQRLNRPKDQEKIKFLKGHLKQAAKKPEGFYSIAGAYEHLPRETKKLVGMLALGGGLYGAAKMRPIFKDLERRAELQQQGKTAAARIGRRGWNFRVQKKFPSSPTKGLKKIRGSTKKFTRSSVAKPRFGNR